MSGVEHRPWKPATDPRLRCVKDHTLWPCDAELLRAENERLRALLEAVADPRLCDWRFDVCLTHQWTGAPCGYGAINEALATPPAGAAGAGE